MHVLSFGKIRCSAQDPGRLIAYRATLELRGCWNATQHHRESLLMMSWPLPDRVGASTRVASTRVIKSTCTSLRGFVYQPRPVPKALD